MTPQRFRLHNVGSMLGTFGVANLQADPNCVLAQLPDYGVWGLQDFPPGTYTETERYQWAAQKQVPWLRRNANTNTETLANGYVFANGSSSSSYTGGDIPAPYANAITFTAGGTVATHFISSTTQPSSLSVVGVTYCSEVVAKAGTCTVLQISFHGSAFGLTSRANFDLSSGQVGTVGPSVTATITSMGNGWYRCRASCVCLSAISGGAGYYVYQVDSTSAANGATSAASATFHVTGTQFTLGEFAEYQPIGASWDATYAALAAAAGFNTGIWQDAGTNPVNTSGQSVYRIADASGKGYTANQATAANRPLWMLDANAKPYLLGDNVNDAMPVTFPASFSSNASVYVTTDAGTTVTDGVTLNGSYAPLVAAKQYARVIFKSGRPAYHEKLIRWLNAKAGL